MFVHNRKTQVDMSVFLTQCFGCALFYTVSSHEFLAAGCGGSIKQFGLRTAPSLQGDFCGGDSLLER